MHCHGVSNAVNCFININWNGIRIIRILCLLSTSSSSLMPFTTCPWFEDNFGQSSYIPVLYSKYVQGDYLLLYNGLRHSDWSFVPSINSVNSAVYNLTAIELETINLAIYYVTAKNPAFPHWFSDSLEFYIKNKNQCFRTYKKSKAGSRYDVFIIIVNWLKHH
jgi:hypothetical protein